MLTRVLPFMSVKVAVPDSPDPFCAFIMMVSVLACAPIIAPPLVDVIAPPVVAAASGAVVLDDVIVELLPEQAASINAAAAAQTNAVLIVSSSPTSNVKVDQSSLLDALVPSSIRL